MHLILGAEEVGSNVVDRMLKIVRESFEAVVVACGIFHKGHNGLSFEQEGGFFGLDIFDAEIVRQIPFCGIRGQKAVRDRRIFVYKFRAQLVI